MMTNRILFAVGKVEVDGMYAVFWTWLVFTSAQQQNIVAYSNNVSPKELVLIFGRSS